MTGGDLIYFYFGISLSQGIKYYSYQVRLGDHQKIFYKLKYRSLREILGLRQTILLS